MAQQTVQPIDPLIPAAELRRRLLDGTIGAVELCDLSIERIERLDPLLNAIPIRCFENARQAALESAARIAAGKARSLEGLPIVIKDLNHVAGVRTTYGSPLFQDLVAKSDDDVVARLRAAGAVILGKSNVPEHGFGATTTNPLFGITRNPFDPALSAAASSGGAAVALAAGLCPLAMGSDFAGSLRTPASFNGICGFRPSNGTVGTARRPLAWSAFDVEGPMGRSPADLKLILAAMAGQSSDDPLSFPRDPDLDQPAGPVDLSRLKVALSEDLGFAPMSRSYRDTFRSKLTLFSGHFAEIRDAHPDLLDADATFLTLRGIGFVADFGPMEAEFGERLGPVVLDELDRARRLTVEEIGNAEKRHTAIFRSAQDFFRHHDLLITPAAAVPPFPHEDIYPAQIDGEDMGGYLRWEAIAYGVTLMHNPAVVIPCGLGPEGMPFGIQIVGPNHSDARLLDIAQTLFDLLQVDPRTAAPVPDLAGLERWAGQLTTISNPAGPSGVMTRSE